MAKSRGKERNRKNSTSGKRHSNFFFFSFDEKALRCSAKLHHERKKRRNHLKEEGVSVLASVTPENCFPL